jgi:hypothetical protein
MTIFQIIKDFFDQMHSPFYTNDDTYDNTNGNTNYDINYDINDYDYDYDSVISNFFNLI